MKLAYGIFYTKNIERISTFYRDVIGLELLSGDSSFVSFKVGDGVLGIKHSVEKREVPGHQTVIIAVQGIDDWYAHLKDRRVNICTVLTAASWGKNFAILDPDGNKVEFVEE